MPCGRIWGKREEKVQDSRAGGFQARMVVYPNRKYMYFARRVSNSMLRILISWPHGAHIFWPQGTQCFRMFCCHLHKKWTLKFPSSVPGLCSHIYSRVHENYWSWPSFLYVGMYLWLLVPILALYNNSVITTAAAWGQCFSPLQGGCSTASSFFLFQTFEWSPSASSVHFINNIPLLWIFQLLGSLNRTGFSSRKKSMPLAGNRAVAAR